MNYKLMLDELHPWDVGGGDVNRWYMASMINDSHDTLGFHHKRL
jgi:hypothetical protein